MKHLDTVIRLAATQLVEDRIRSESGQSEHRTVFDAVSYAVHDAIGVDVAIDVHIGVQMEAT